jgi:hypothetical protein
MKKNVLGCLALSALLISCGAPSNSNDQSEKELLERELALLKKEKALLEVANVSESVATKVNSVKADVRASQFVLSKNAVGSFSIGAKLPKAGTYTGYEVRKVVERTEAEGEVREEVSYLILSEGEQIMELQSDYKNSQLIGEILVKSPIVKNAKGIGVGSTINDFTELYSNYKLWYTYVSNRYVLESGNDGIQFILDNKGFMGTTKGTSAQETVNKKDFNTTTAITAIRLF